MIAIVNYGMGNLLSVFNAVEYLGWDAKICDDPKSLDDASKIIIPGVGAFGSAMENLLKSGFVESLNRQVLETKKPCLGICLGAQLLARCSYELGKQKGLGWIDAEVIRVTPDDPALRVPHVGWNEVNYVEGSWLFDGIKQGKCFYFVHSYRIECEGGDSCTAWCDYGGKITAVVQKENITGTQFHPEKSQDNGLTLLENWLKRQEW